MPMTKDEAAIIRQIQGGGFAPSYYSIKSMDLSPDFLTAFKNLLIEEKEAEGNRRALKAIIVIPSLMEKLNLKREEQEKIERNMLSFIQNEPSELTPLFAQTPGGNPLLKQFLNQFRSQQVSEVVNETAQLYSGGSYPVKKKKEVRFDEKVLVIPISEKPKLDLAFEAAEKFREMMLAKLSAYKPSLLEKRKVNEYLEKFEKPLDINQKGTAVLGQLLQIINEEGILPGSRKKQTDLGKYLADIVIPAEKEYSKFTTAAPIKKLTPKR